MKLLVCRDCLDVVKLRSRPDSCRCGRSGGTYLADDVRAAAWGPCEVLAIDNEEFRSAVLLPGSSGTWTVLPRQHPRVFRFHDRAAAADSFPEARR
jgi:hypothetical protein